MTSPPAAATRLLDELALPHGRRLRVLADDQGTLHTVPLAAAGDRRAAPGDGAAEALVALLRHGSARVGAFEVVHRYADEATGEAAVPVDQTHESVVVGGTAVVKWVVEPSPEPHPAPARLDLLAAAGFTEMPRPWGWLLWHDLRGGPESAPVLLATVTGYLAGARDGWGWAVDDARAVGRGEVPPDLAAGSSLGALTARLHAALASDGTRPATAAEAAWWHRQAVADLDRAVREMDGPEGERLRALAGRARVRLAPLADAAGTPVTTVHGDLHVGQVLRHGAGYAVTDFDGSPVLAPADRGARRPAAVDVAGMLQSLDHVARVVVRRTQGVDPAVVLRWARQARADFLEAYVDGLAVAGRAGLLDRSLLAPLRVQQECRELLYAVAHLPHWRYVPDAALPDLLDELDDALGGGA